MRRISSARWAFPVLWLWLALASASAATLLETNTTWRFFRGRTEASAPDAAAWRARGFADATWEQGPAPFFYGEPLEPLNGTLIGDMAGQYSTLFLRARFNVGNPGLVRTLQLRAVCDDGFAAWINGVRVAGLNAPAEPLTRQSLATANVAEPVAFATYDLPDPAAYLVAGENVLAVQVFNNTLTSSDLVFDAVLEAEEVASASPAIASVTPAPGIVAQLNQVTVTFSEPVQGMQASDFLINGASAWSVTGGGASYTFTFPRPPYGTVLASWSPLHTITDLESPPRRFELSSPGASWQYELADPAGPAVAVRQPPAGATARALRAVAVTFDKPVLGVDAGDLQVNGVAATNVTGYGNGPFTFEFPPVAAGAAEVSWTPGHGIESDAVEPRPFSGENWSYAVNAAFQPPALRVREMMAENYSAYRDEDQDPEDWIEIRNTGGTPVNLDGWSLSDDDDEPGQWVFPAVVLQPDGHLVVFASGKDRRPLNGRLHTNFKLNPNGGMVGVYPPELPRVPVDVVEFPEQRPDYSWALQPPGGTNDWRYFLRGSPGIPNSFSPITGVVDEVHFSVPRGFFPSSFNLSLHCATPGAVIRYTTNGAPPTATNGFVYAAPIPISASRVVRAAAFASNALPSRVTTHTYLVNLAATRLRLPALSLVTDTNNLYGRTGIMEYNPRNCAQRGPKWERPVSVELIRPGDNGGFVVDAGLRVQGGDHIRGQYNYRAGSPPQNKYSFRLYFRGEYGQGRLEYPLFPETTQESFDTIVLRAGMNDHTNPYLTDEFVRTLARDTGQPAAVGTFVHLFINGVYRGYYNPCERVDVDFLQAYHGGGRLWDVMAQFGEVREGDVTAWNTLRNLCNNTSRPLTNPTNYLAVADRLDLVNFVDYLLPLIYVDNDDWPHNNWRAARERVPGGRYRFYAWDSEWACGIVNGHSPSFNTINGQLSSTAPPWGGTDIQQIFNGLKRSPEFQQLFADRVHRHLYNGGALTDERIRTRYEQVRARLNGVVSGFNNSIASTWIPQRRRHLLTHLNTAGFLKSSNAPAMSQFGGRIAPGFRLTLTNQTGAIWYTRDGTDPRVPIAGTVHSNALAYSGPVTLAQSLVFKARSLAGTNWSALTEAAFTVESLGSQVRFAEIMYNPAGGDAFEYLELINAGGVPVDVAGWSIEGVNFRFPTPFPAVAPGARLLLGNDANTNLFHQRYGPVPAAGRFGGSLANGGERLALLDRDGRVVTSVTYGDSGPWPDRANGGGFSLEVADPAGDPNSPGNWRDSGQQNGTPGQPPGSTPSAGILLSEIFAGGGTNQSDFVELFNAGNALIQLAGWTLEDGGTPFTFPAGASLAPGAYLVVLCDRLTNAPGYHAPFALNRSGDTLWLTDATGRRVDALAYGPQAGGWGAGLVAGRWVTTEPTPGGPNEAAVTAPADSLAINEWLASPLPGDDDWVELHNAHPLAPVSLDGLYLGTSNALFRLALPGAVAPSGFVRLRADESPDPGHLGFRLPATGGAIILYDATGAELSRVTYSAQTEGVTSGRVPDATGLPVRLPGTPSPGGSNYLAFVDGPRLNEFLARNQGSVTNPLGRVADFIELHNPAATNVPLAGFRLSVGDAEPGEWAFPTGTVLPARGHLVVWADPDVPATTNPAPVLQLGRGLPAEGTTLWLFNDRGQA
ncbi:MAG: lamin tail domain-containing protein, partial [Limisphaerales bacterium]